MLNGLAVTGMVRSVKEHQSSNPMRWTVTVVPKQGMASPPLSAAQASSVCNSRVAGAFALATLAAHRGDGLAAINHEARRHRHRHKT